jgi:hypothetical protein
MEVHCGLPLEIHNITMEVRQATQPHVKVEVERSQTLASLPVFLSESTLTFITNIEFRGSVQDSLCPLPFLCVFKSSHVH